MDNNPEKESRKFVRRDADIPIEIGLGDLVAHKKEYLNNISFGGLSFKSRDEVKAGTVINIRIPLVRPMFETKTVGSKGYIHRSQWLSLFLGGRGSLGGHIGVSPCGKIIKSAR